MYSHAVNGIPDFVELAKLTKPTAKNGAWGAPPIYAASKHASDCFPLGV